MAEWINSKGEKVEKDLTKYSWSVTAEENWDHEYYSYGEYLDNHQVEITWDDPVLPEEIFEDIVYGYPDISEPILLSFMYDADDDLKMFPKATYISYPTYDSKVSDTCVTAALSGDEKQVFTKLLQEAIGDKHDPEMQKVMINYHNSVDGELKNFIHDILAGRDVLPMTVGFVNETMAKEIQALTGTNTLGNRIVIGSDDIRHILNRHGVNGKADHSMQDIDDIARLCYVLANYDSIEWDGGVSNLYKTKDGKKAPQITIKKRINGTYYIIEVASDSSKKRNIVSTVYLKKTTD